MSVQNIDWHPTAKAHIVAKREDLERQRDETRRHVIGVLRSLAKLYPAEYQEVGVEVLPKLVLTNKAA